MRIKIAKSMFEKLSFEYITKIIQIRHIWTQYRARIFTVSTFPFREFCQCRKFILTHTTNIVSKQQNGSQKNEKFKLL